MRFKSLLAVGIAGLGALALPSCATNDSMMFIVGVFARRAGECEPKPEGDAPILAKGTLDRSFASEYRAALLIGNQITQRGSREQLRTETSRVVLKGAEVNLEDLLGNSLAPAFSSTATGFVDAAGGTDASLAIMYATLIPGSLVGELPPGTVLAKVRVFGDTLGGQEVESSELAFPIEVCDGCLISYPASARDLTADGNDYVCKIGTTSDDAVSDEVALPCNVGIDIPAPCTVCSGFAAVCQTPLNNCTHNKDAMILDADGNPQPCP
jgi:hypothetical protein